MAIYHSPYSYLKNGNGTSLDNVPYSLPIDLTDGSWTLFDPDSLVANVSHSNGFNTVVWNNLAPGNQNYNWGSGASHRSPRWYKDLEINGSQVTVEDIIQAIFWVFALTQERL
jgi:hypothetical protein